MRPILLIMWTAFQSFILRDNDNNNNNRPDIVVLEKEGRVCFIVDVACSFDAWVAEKETEKIDHFKDLKVEVQIKI